MGYVWKCELFVVPQVRSMSWFGGRGSGIVLFIQYDGATIVCMGGGRSLEWHPLEAGGRSGVRPFGVVRRTFVRLGPSPFVCGGGSACVAGFGAYWEDRFLSCAGGNGGWVFHSHVCRHHWGSVCGGVFGERCRVLYMVSPGHGYLFLHANLPHGVRNRDGWVVGGVIVRRSPMVRRDSMFDFAFGHIPVITCHWLDGRWICWWLPGTWYDDGNVCVTCGVIGSAVGHDISLQGRRIVVGRLHFDGRH